MIDDEIYNHIQFLKRLKNSIEETSRTRPLTIEDRKMIDGKGPRTVLTSSQMEKIKQILQLLGEESSNSIQQSKTLDYCSDIQRIIDILTNKEDINILKRIYDKKKRILDVLFELEMQQYGFYNGEITTCPEPGGLEPGD